MDEQLKYLMRLSLGDVKLMQLLFKLADEASEAEKLVQSKFVFQVKQTEIFTRNSDGIKEWITRDGIWNLRYKGNEFQIKCEADEIFMFFKAELLVERYGVDSNNEENMKKAMAVAFFRTFIKNIKEK